MGLRLCQEGRRKLDIVGSRTFRLGKWWQWLDMGIHRCLKGQWACSCGLMQRRSMPKELILVNFPEATVLPSSELQLVLCAGGVSPVWGEKLASVASYCPTSTSWALSKQTFDLLMLKSHFGSESPFLPRSCFWSPPSCVSSLQSLPSRIVPLPWSSFGCYPLCTDVGNYIPCQTWPLLTINNPVLTQFLTTGTLAFMLGI